MKKSITSTILNLFARAATAAVASQAVSGCVTMRSNSDKGEIDPTPRSAKVHSPFTGRVFDQAEIRRGAPRAIFGEDCYAEVNAEWLKYFYRDFRGQLHRLGITKWDARFDCNRFADLFTTLAQVKFFHAAFHSTTPAKALALGPYWYIRSNGSAHALIQAITQDGPVLFDPQSGEIVHLTPAESQAAFMQFF